jgi:hypothetical protein
VWRAGRIGADREGTVPVPGTLLRWRCGGGAVAVAVAGAGYILHLRESTPRSKEYCRQRGLGGVFC